MQGSRDAVRAVINSLRGFYVSARGLILFLINFFLCVHSLSSVFTDTLAWSNSFILCCIVCVDLMMQQETWCFTSTKTVKLIRDGEKMGGKGVWRCGESEIIYLSLHCHHQNDSCIKMGSNESHFNVSLIVRDKVTRQCSQTTSFEEKGEPKRIRTEVPLLTSLTPYR